MQWMGVYVNDCMCGSARTYKHAYAYIHTYILCAHIQTHDDIRLTHIHDLGICHDICLTHVQDLGICDDIRLTHIHDQGFCHTPNSKTHTHMSLKGTHTHVSLNIHTYGTWTHIESRCI